jgi:hypothetical protein
MSDELTIIDKTVKPDRQVWILYLQHVNEAGETEGGGIRVLDGKMTFEGNLDKTVEVFFKTLVPKLEDWMREQGPATVPLLPSPPTEPGWYFVPKYRWAGPVLLPEVP